MRQVLATEIIPRVSDYPLGKAGERGQHTMLFHVAFEVYEDIVLPEARTMRNEWIGPQLQKIMRSWSRQGPRERPVPSLASLSMDIPRLIVRPRGGLGNRMRVITSFQILASYSGRVFELCWAPSAGWSEEDLGDLFENDFPRVSLDEFERYSQDGLDLHNAVQILGHSNERTWEWREGSGMHQVFDLAAFPLVTYSGHKQWEWLVDPATRARLSPNLKSDYQASLKEWSPVSSIRAEVERLAASFGPHTVGVHIRRGDAWTDAKGRPRAEYRRSTDAAFIARMDAELAAEPRTDFFLATDCAATEERFCERYGEMVIVNCNKRFVPSVPKRPKDNQRDAVIDMFALARTRKILGNNRSSFSKMAAGIGGIEFQRVLED